MKTCPNCNELLGDAVDRCFNCGYNFSLKRVPTQEEVDNMEKQEKERKERKEQEAIRKEQLLKELNPIYEYKVVKVLDSDDGSVSQHILENTINTYAAQGWKLSQVFTNEIGKQGKTIGVGGFGESTNSTIDEIIIVFERRAV